MQRVSLSALQVAGLLVVALAAGGVGAVLLDQAPTEPAEPSGPTGPTGPTDQPRTADGANVSTFDSAEAFRSYLREAESTGGTTLASGGQAARPRSTDVERDVATSAGGDDGSDVDGGDGGTAARRDAVPTPAAASTPQAEPAASNDGGGAGEAADGDRRASGTNVQVEGVDEPDVLKTTPDALYYATEDRHIRPTVRGDDGARLEREGGVRLIDADDPAAPEVASRLNVSGRLLLANDSLVVFEDDRLVGYDVADRANPERTWTKELEDRVVTARLHAGTVYLVTEDRVDRGSPCPIRPMEDVSVPCTQVHHPTRPAQVDATYTVSLLDPAEGSVADSTSFVGAGGQSVVYVSGGSVYVTYPRPVDQADLFAAFLVTDGAEHLDSETVDRIEEIREYDLSSRAKRVEIEHTLQQWRAGLDEDERRDAQRDLREARESWAAEHKRDFERTGIVAFDVEGVESGSPTVKVGATGSVPGRPLNQFSLDEHDGEFRIATTVSGAMSADSENDLYVLDGDLDVTGSVRGMGVTERIYSVRYVGDEAYVVTFRRIDPFHVLDLSDPADPTLEGELKLPGFSSYLHPLDDDRVLGIGEEDGKVKLVVFDVSDPADPTIDDERLLDARFSAVAESHHAFLLDRRHGVFFLPTDGERHPRPTPMPTPVEGGGDIGGDGDSGGDGAVATSDRVAPPPGGQGYVFSYEDGLEEVTTVETRGSTRRASYVGDHLYVFGESSLTVVDEETWDETATLNFTDGN